MKLKQLEGLLGSLQQFESPKIELEQYPTGAHIASRLLYTAENSYEDISGKVVADFGCGCGTLGLAAALLDAEHVIGIDVDAESIEIATSNAEELELNMDFIQCDIRHLPWQGRIVDTVVMNPPFGTRKKGADMEFLALALKVASRAVYSLHKTTTRDTQNVHLTLAAAKDTFSLKVIHSAGMCTSSKLGHPQLLSGIQYIKRTALRDYNASSAEVICELRYDVPQLYKFHKKKEVDLAVDLWRFVPKTD